MPTIAASPAPIQSPRLPTLMRPNLETRQKVTPVTQSPQPDQQKKVVAEVCLSRGQHQGIQHRVKTPLNPKKRRASNQIPEISIYKFFLLENHDLFHISFHV